MSETRAGYRAELAGLPAEEAVVPEWLHLCEVAGPELAMVRLALLTMEHLPGLPAGHAETYRQAADNFSSQVMQEIGRVAWGAAIDEAIPRWNTLRRLATERTASQQRRERHHAR